MVRTQKGETTGMCATYSTTRCLGEIERRSNRGAKRAGRSGTDGGDRGLAGVNERTNENAHNDGSERRYQLIDEHHSGKKGRWMRDIDDDGRRRQRRQRARRGLAGSELGSTIDLVVCLLLVNCSSSPLCHRCDLPAVPYTSRPHRPSSFPLFDCDACDLCSQQPPACSSPGDRPAHMPSPLCTTPTVLTAFFLLLRCLLLS
ncbi:hypothetical protein PLICRDRAFT_243423 [Plicaturopsis crispa FD-325 SS-3]|nr:hypothetical protein PLICRDRAFT_243423 [Plicaturopsis crispa FD-325 SS-3]